MLAGLIGGAIIGLGCWYSFRYGGKRYWSIGLAVLLAGAGWFSGVQNAPSINSIWGSALGFAIGAAFVGLSIGAVVDLWRYLSGRSTSSNDRKGVPYSPSSGDGSTRGDANHELLGVTPDAGPEEITAAYQAMMRKHNMQSVPAPPPSATFAPHQERLRSTTSQNSNTVFNLALFLGVPIAVVLGVVWLGSKWSTKNSAPELAEQASLSASSQADVHDVRMPNGTIVKNVPKVITKSQLLEKLEESGYDVNRILYGTERDMIYVEYNSLLSKKITWESFGVEGGNEVEGYEMRGSDGALYTIDESTEISKQVAEGKIVNRAQKVKYKVRGPDDRIFLVQAPASSSEKDAIIYIGYREYGIGPSREEGTVIVYEFSGYECVEGCRSEY